MQKESGKEDLRPGLVKVSRVERGGLRAGPNIYTATMPVEQVPDLMNPSSVKKADF